RFSRDWSSDVCSSDLLAALLPGVAPARLGGGRLGNLVVDGAVGIADRRPDHPPLGRDLVLDHRVAIIGDGVEATEFLLRVVDQRSEERRVGKEGRYRW